MSNKHHPGVMVYLAGPYRDARGAYYVRQNIREAELVAIELWRMGYAVICPHLNSQLLDGAVPDGTFLRGGLVMLARCNVMVVLPNWEASEGSCVEVEYARQRDIETLFWPADLRRIRELAPLRTATGMEAPAPREHIVTSMDVQ